MKTYIILMTFLVVLFSGSIVSAQSLTATTSQASVSVSQEDQPIILSKFKADKEQKKVIGQVKRYVTPKVFNGSRAAERYAGKMVKVQLGISADGSIDHLVIVKPLEPGIDKRVLKLVRAFWTEESSNLDLNTPDVIQLNIPVATKKYYGGSL